MSTVTVRAEMQLTWLNKGETVTVESTPLIRGALKSGMLKLVESAVQPSPVPVEAAPVRATPAKAAKRSRKR